MLRSVKQLYGEKLTAIDGDIGSITDFYFDDQQWTVRYIVVETGPWLSTRSVLISPHAFEQRSQEGKFLSANLTRQQIENSPATDSHKPVSRQYEEEYFRYYGWPPYWNGGGIWGVADLPVAPPPPYYPLPGQQTSEEGGSDPDNDLHLRSTQGINGYHIETGAGTIGHVSDLLMSEKNWAIGRLVVETGHWFSRKEILISPKNIDKISYEESKVFVSISKEDILEAPEYHLPAHHATSPDAQNYQG